MDDEKKGRINDRNMNEYDSWKRIWEIIDWNWREWGGDEEERKFWEYNKVDEREEELFIYRNEKRNERNEWRKVEGWMGNGRDLINIRNFKRSREGERKGGYIIINDRKWKRDKERNFNVFNLIDFEGNNGGRSGGDWMDCDERKRNLNEKERKIYGNWKIRDCDVFRNMDYGEKNEEDF